MAGLYVFVKIILSCLDAVLKFVDVIIFRKY